ncbi:cell division protein SepF [Corynebacterium kutscheri]|uniref:Cell division protein SepF n=1 Tax=Corynebacterium kutscheri TaxID=35755 RepID=A0A0F6R0Y3_9CORY|nr:cell division protein SepF [Corynebacterium kutscheri]AKE41555.1 hypothetical protein UL82_06950 [Corynebacterium kutscheri]VEH08834.1 cell division protein SepF [Corynebacterium kutscheri]VEH09879.1 cell division protein SepF [Corynebacterium kutscheri]VEH79963.1 cell division protein SepF [Corynebacterium kutscheri]
MSAVNSIKNFFGLGDEHVVADYIEDDEYYREEPVHSDYLSERDYGHRYESERRITARPRLETIALTHYREARRVGESFREGNIVVMDITRLERQDMTRMVDFAAGLKFALEGQLEKLAKGFFVLAPKGAVLDTEEIKARIGIA